MKANNPILTIDESQLKIFITKIVMELLQETNSKEEKELLTSKEAAEYLKIKIRTIYNYRTQKKIRPTKMVGNSPRYSRKMLDSIL